MMRTAVVIMSKVPVPGLTKTRLMSLISGQECADFHRACLADTCRAVRMSGLPGFIYYADGSNSVPRLPEDAIWGMADEDQRDFSMRPQRGEDLGERMWHAAGEILAEFDAVVFLGSDMPQLTGGMILEAQEIMEVMDIVLGPALDGGYYLLGMKTPAPEIFRDIPWGTSQVLQRTLETIQGQQLSCGLMRWQSDIDTIDDLKQFHLAGKTEENMAYRKLAAYKSAGGLIAKYAL